MRLATVVLLLTLCDVLPAWGADYSVLLLAPDGRGRTLPFAGRGRSAGVATDFWIPIQH